MNHGYWPSCLLFLLTLMGSEGVIAAEPADALGDHMVLQRQARADLGNGQAGRNGCRHFRKPDQNEYRGLAGPLDGASRSHGGQHQVARPSNSRALKYSHARRRLGRRRVDRRGAIEHGT